MANDTSPSGFVENPALLKAEWNGKRLPQTLPEAVARVKGTDSSAAPQVRRLSTTDQDGPHQLHQPIDRALVQVVAQIQFWPVTPTFSPSAAEDQDGECHQPQPISWIGKASTIWSRKSVRSAPVKDRQPGDGHAEVAVKIARTSQAEFRDTGSISTTALSRMKVA